MGLPWECFQMLIFLCGRRTLPPFPSVRMSLCAPDESDIYTHLRGIFPKSWPALSNYYTKHGGKPEGLNGHRWDSPSVSILTQSTVELNGMDICWNSPSVSIASHGTVGWDGMDIVVISPVCPLLLSWWYSGMGWTFVRQWRMSQEH